MTKAEEAAKKKYPIYWAKAVMSDGNTIEFDASETTRNVFKLGYEQAEKDINKEMTNIIEKYKEMQEKALLTDHNYDIHIEQAKKDLALTIQDLELLHTFLYAVKNNKHGAFTFTRLSNEQYQEVLKRFKDAKK